MNAAKLESMKFGEFTAYITANPKRYGTLSRYRKILASSALGRNERKKLSFIEKEMEVILAKGLETKRRKPGTGTRVVVKKVYGNTPANIRKGLVGKEYEKVEYHDAEVETRVRTRMRRRKRQMRANSDGTGHRNAWITAVAEAKKELGTKNFVIVRKEVLDPEDEDQVLGHKVYLRAKEIMEAAKAAEPAEPATEAASDEPAMEAEAH